MKKIIFYGMIFALSGTVFAGEYGKRYIPCTIKNEKLLRNELYRSYAADSDFYRKCLCQFSTVPIINGKNTVCSCEFFKNMDFFITILEAHIQKLQKKIIKPNVFFRSKSIGIGCGYLGLGLFLVALDCLFLQSFPWPKKEDYVEYIRDYQKALEYAKSQFFDNNMRNFLSRSRFEKNFESRFLYLEKYSISNHLDHQLWYIMFVISLPYFSYLCTVKAFHLFRKFSASAERQPGHLQRDEVLLAIFKEKRHMRDRGFGY